MLQICSCSFVALIDQSQVLKIVWYFLHDLHFCFAYYGLIFLLMKEKTTIMVSSHLRYVHLIDFDFVGVASV